MRLDIVRYGNTCPVAAGLKTRCVCVRCGSGNALLLCLADACLTLLTFPSANIRSCTCCHEGMVASSCCQCTYVPSSHQSGNRCMALRCGVEFLKAFMLSMSRHTVTVQKTIPLSISSFPATRPAVRINSFTDRSLAMKKAGKLNTDLSLSRVTDMKYMKQR